MKKFFIKYDLFSLSMGIIFMLLGWLYPDDSSFDNYLAAGFYLLSALGFVGYILGTIFKMKNK
tara:strand:+ start:808 stop:996 length:189 start_codon:yes stop_codon:yes gene_type:complete